MPADSPRPLFQQRYPAELAELPRIKSEVRAAARLTGWSDDNLDRLELVLEEGVVNIISHAYPGCSGEVEVTLMPAEVGLLLRLEDAGIPFDPVSAPLPDLDASADKRRIGGLGIFLMKNSSEAFSYRREGGNNVLDIVLTHQGTDT